MFQQLNIEEHFIIRDVQNIPRVKCGIFYFINQYLLSFFSFN